jgi:hypothetical protein
MVNKFLVRMKLLNLFLVLISCILSVSLVLAIPSGGQVTGVSNSTGGTSNPSWDNAYAGNVSELVLYGSSITQSWQGYFGNVTGAIRLADGSGNVMYNWSLTNPTGEVYSSFNDSIIWTNIQCFNYTAAGTYADDSGQAGATSRFGMNITQLESIFNISSTDVDGVDETFSLNNHAAFYTNSKQFGAGECNNSKIFTQNGTGYFDEVLLYSPDTQVVVFTSILKSDAKGFDGAKHDFEMLVLEDGRNGNIELTPYYFYLELQ